MMKCLTASAVVLGAALTSVPGVMAASTPMDAFQAVRAPQNAPTVSFDYGHRVASLRDPAWETSVRAWLTGNRKDEGKAVVYVRRPGKRGVEITLCRQSYSGSSCAAFFDGPPHPLGR